MDFTNLLDLKSLQFEYRLLLTDVKKEITRSHWEG